jgi:hypothetical protein
VAVRPNSWRAAAIIIQGNGDSTGAVGELPANGLGTALTGVDTATVATATGSLAFTIDVAGGCSSGFSTVTLTVGATSSATLGSSAFLGSSAVLVDSVASERTVAFFFFGFGSAAAGLISLESVDASASTSTTIPSPK